MDSKTMRTSYLFMRNNYTPSGYLGIPLVRKQKLEITNINLIACSDTKLNENKQNRQFGVHFFVDDYRFEGIYRNPSKSLKKFSQYAFILTPDFSTYADMNQWRQIESVAHNRWCGAYWQSKGLTVIPTISWSTPTSYKYCFDGVENGSIVAIGMIGCKNNKLRFMRGYDAMCEKINPEAIICFGKPFPEMRGNLKTINYTFKGKVVH